MYLIADEIIGALTTIDESTRVYEDSENDGWICDYKRDENLWSKQLSIKFIR